MIFTESTITISNNNAKINSPIVLYRGDKNVEIRFTILQSPFKYSNTVATNIIESTNASYGQLVIKTPNDKPPIFSEVSATKEGTILFTITKEMIDEIEEVGAYTFQIRLMDENKQSRATIPPVENGIEIKEPIAIEDDNTTNVVGLAKANYAVATLSDVDTPTFDDNGKYIKTNWNDGDIITNVSLNKIEDGIYTTNENVTATKKYVDDNTVIHPLPVHQIQENDKTILKIVDIMDLIEGVTYSTQKDINQTKSQGYRIVYICDDGTFRLICTLPLVNKVIHLLKVIHFTNYSTLSDNNITYKVDYTNHSTNTDIQITKTLQNYIPIANNIEYTPTREYHPATKKYADDKFICTDIVDNVGTISKEEMQKCNNGTSRYVSSIKFKEFFADYEHCIYQGTYGDKKIRMKYDKDYNRMIAYDLTDVIQLGFEFNNNYMYPFNAGTDEVKAYQFTNDLVITKSPVLNPSEVLTKNNTHEYTPTNDYHPATKKYVDDIKTGIDGIKADLGTAQLTTNAKDVKGAVNEVNAQYKDIAKLKNLNEDTYKLYNNNIPKIFKPFEYPTGFDGTYKPVTIYYDGKNFKTDFKKENFMYSSTETSKTYYISPTGDWQNDGLSKEKPVKFYQGLNRGADGDTIKILEGVYLIDQLDQQEYNIAKNINIIAEANSTFIFGGRKKTFTFDSSHSLWKTTQADVRRIISSIDFDFEFIKVNSLELCKTIINSWYLDSNGDVYINSLNNPTDNVYLVCGTVGLTCKNTENCKVYIENLTVIGGKCNFMTSKNPSYDLECIFNNCKFLYNIDKDKTAFRIGGGNILTNNCIIKYSKGDGFGYLAENSNLEKVTTNFCELNCVGCNNGIGGTQDNMNGSTAHSGIKGIRINGLYYNNFGGNVADVQQDTKTLNLGCVVFDSCGTSMNQGFGLQQAGATMWLYNCVSYGNSADLVAYGNTTAYIHDCKLGKIAGGGTIAEI